MELIIIKEDSPSWNEMWEWLGNHPLNEGVAEPMIAMNDVNGEGWQYMGSFRHQDGRVVHSFRHRSHPLDGDKKTLNYGVSNIADNDIERVLPIK